MNHVDGFQDIVESGIDSESTLIIILVNFKSWYLNPYLADRNQTKKFQD